LEPADAGLTLPSPLSLGANQFALLISLEVCFMCGVLIDILVPRETELERGGRPPARQGGPHVECAKLSLWAVGHPLSAQQPRWSGHRSANRREVALEQLFERSNLLDDDTVARICTENGIPAFVPGTGSGGSIQKSMLGVPIPSGGQA
jgi:hypothetical protein